MKEYLKCTVKEKQVRKMEYISLKLKKKKKILLLCND